MPMRTSLIKVYICRIVVEGYLPSGQGKVVLKEDIAKYYMIVWYDKYNMVTDSFFVMKSTYTRKNDW